MTDPTLEELVTAEVARVGGGSPIAAAVEDGVVTLTGVVKDEVRRTLVEQELLALPGVLNVHNHLHVPLPAGEPVQQLRALLERIGARAAGIGIAVADGVVTLSGDAESWFDRDAAERMAWMLPGVHAVENRVGLPVDAVVPDGEGGASPVA